MKNSAKRVIEVGVGAASLLMFVVLAACGAIIGTRDLVEEDGGGDAADGRAIDANTPQSQDGAPQAEAGDASVPDGAGSDSAPPSCTGVDLQTDPHHCGRCDHDCLGGGCEGGACQAFPVVPNQSGANGIALDDTGVYWTSSDQGQVLHAAKDGTQKVVVANEPGSKPFGVVVDATDVYWTAINTESESPPGRVNRCAKSGCPAGPTHLTPALREPYGIAIDGANVYWSEYDNGAVGRVSKTGAGFGYLVTQQGFAGGIALQDPWLYFASSSEVGAVAPDGSVVAKQTDTATAPFRTIKATPGTADFNPHGIAIDDTNVYWTNRTILSPTINFAPKGSTGQSPVSTLAPTVPMPTSVAVDDANVYWVGQGVNSAQSGGNAVYVNGVLATCPKAGCPGGIPIVLARDLHNPFWVAVDATAVYFTIRGNSAGEGAIMKIAK